jgi:hypothetical protein
VASEISEDSRLNVTSNPVKINLGGELEGSFDDRDEAHIYGPRGRRRGLA